MDYFNGKEALVRACHLMHEEHTEPYDAYALSWLVTVLAELNELNNGLREEAGLEPQTLSEMLPATMDEALTLRPELENACVYGLLLKIYAGENSTPLIDVYTSMYEREKLLWRRRKMTFVVD